MTESFTYIDMVCGKYGTHPEEKRIHLMDNDQIAIYCAWKARTKMVTDYKKYLAIDKRTKLINSELMTRWDLHRELFRVYLRYATQEDDFDRKYEDLKYYYKMEIYEKRTAYNQLMYHLEPRIVKKFDANLNIVYVKTCSFPEYWKACGYKRPFPLLLSAKKKICDSFVKYKYNTNYKSKLQI